MPNQNIEDDFEKLERAFTGYAIFFKHQARKVKGRATRKDFQQKALISSMLAMICNNLRTII